MRPAVLVFVFGVALAQSSDPPSAGPQVSQVVQQLARIRQHMQERLAQVPNYTCLQTTVRTERADRTAKPKKLDTVRLEVAEVDKHELFARPGQPFTNAGLEAFVRRGAIASGMFAMFANALFASNAAAVSWAGEEEMAGRKMLRYDFKVPLERSGYTIQGSYKGAIVGYHGSFWADPRTLDAFHLRIVADAIPAALGLLETMLEIEYQTVRIGASEALLPRSADLLLTEYSGVERRNQTEFSRCKQYGSESVVTFGAPDAPPAPAKPK